MSMQLAVYNTNTRRLEGLDPANATAIAIPTARVMQNLPAAGSVVGELVNQQSNNITYIWDGSNWNPIISDFLHTFPTDADILAATIPNGHIAISQASGNFFVRTANGFRQWGLREYPTRAGLLADIPPDGSIAVSMDDRAFWMRAAGDWRPITTVEFADPAAVVAWAAPDGSQAFESTYGTSYFRANGQWNTRGVWQDAEATILANNDMIEGQIAFATDTGQMWVRTATGWSGSPIRSYATDAGLQADTPPDGVLAWANDTGLAYMRSGGNWVRINSPTITAAAAAPAGPATGDIHFEVTNGVANIYDGNAWRAIGGAPTGTVIQHVSLAPPPGYLLCDGSPIPVGTQYDALRNLVGPNTPDLRSQFIRGAINQNQIDGFTKHSDTTRRPRTSNFIGSTNTQGNHVHPMNVGTGENAAYYSSHQSNISFNNGGNTWTVDGITKRDAPGFEWSAGAHNHTVNINGGGDPETAPPHIYLAHHIKY